MKLVNQSWKYVNKPNYVKMVKSIESAGRLCYQSESRGFPEAFIRKRIKTGHLSILEHEIISVQVITDRGVTHEIVRHRIAAYSQESTRYCNYSTPKLGIKFILPVDFILDADDRKLLKVIEDHYNKCIADGRTPQQARYFLPNGLKTEIRITYNLREWKHFFSLRTVEGAHPQMIALATDILEHFKKDFPVFFMDML